MTSQDLKVEKFHLKEMALEVQGKGKIDRTRFLKAKAFLNELLENDLFENDYFVYRRLAMLYSDNKYFDEEYQIIKSFFKSGIYAHNYHFLWFRNKFRRLVEKKITTEEELDELVKYYKEHYLKNKHKQNKPTFIAERIIKKRGSVTTISESDYNQNQFRFELVETAEEYRRLGKYDKAIGIYNDLIFNKKMRQFKFYQRLAALYRKTGQKEEEINIIYEYIENNPYKKEDKVEEFRKRLDSIGDYSFPSSKKENKNNSTNDGFIDFLLKNGPSADISEFNKDSDDDVEFDLEDELDLDEEIFTDE